MIARSPGKPCIKGQITNSDGTSLNPTARWATTSRGIGSAAGAATQPPGTGNYYTTTALFRVAFDGTGTGVRYYSCLQRNADGAATDCTVIGTGNYRIDTLGDARVMRLLGLPAITQRTGSEPAFVERGGLVYPGYRNLQTVHQFLAFNLDAANALLTQLGLQPLAPIPPASAADAARAALFATIKGAWTIFDGNNAIVFRFGDDGTYLMAQSSADPTSAEQPGLERGFIDIDPATHNYRTLIATDTNWESGLSNPGPGEGTIPTITPTQISGPGFSFNRLPNDPNGIVGMWAQATSGLNTKHVVVFPNGRVLFIDPVGETTPPDVDDPCIDANAGPPGIEWASYTFDPTTGALQVFGKQIDTNGCSGIFDSSPGAPPNATQSFVLTFSADKSSFTNERGYTFYRVAP